MFGVCISACFCFSNDASACKHVKSNGVQILPVPIIGKIQVYINIFNYFLGEITLEYSGHSFLSKHSVLIKCLLIYNHIFITFIDPSP